MWRAQPHALQRDSRRTDHFHQAKVSQYRFSQTLLPYCALVEQNVSRALSLVDRAYVLESGRVTMQGKSDELANSKQVQSAYLGI